MTTRVFKELPKPYITYPKIIKSMLPLIGNTDKGSKDALPVATYSVNKFKVDRNNLNDYRRLCGFNNDGTLPVTYLAVLSQSVQMNMMVDEPFPFAMLGLVHIKNTVTQHRAIKEDEVLSMTVEFANLADHAKGKQFDFITKVYNGEALVWEGASTYLSRQKRTKKSENSLAGKPVDASSLNAVSFKDLENDSALNIVFEVPESIGRRYAAVSGDFNLIHLHPLTAKAFGFPKAIAHGMWSKAKCLSLMTLPESFTAEVEFKLPIYLPAEVMLQGSAIELTGTDDECIFKLTNAKNEKPHLVGRVSQV